MGIESDAEAGDGDKVEMKDMKDKEEIEELDKDEKPKGDDENQGAPAATPEPKFKDAGKASKKASIVELNNDIDGKAEVEVYPNHLMSEKLGTDDSVGEIPVSENSHHFKEQKNNIRSTKELRAGE